MPEEVHVGHGADVNEDDDERHNDKDPNPGSDCECKDGFMVERPKMWIEDLVSAVDSVVVGLRAKCAEPSPETEQRVQEVCYNIGLTFAWMTGDATRNGVHHMVRSA